MVHRMTVGQEHERKRDGDSVLSRIWENVKKKTAIVCNILQQKLFENEDMERLRSFLPPTSLANPAFSPSTPLPPCVGTYDIEHFAVN